MADNQNRDDLKELISIQQQLNKNTDAVKEQLQSAGRLGESFRSVLNLTKQLNSTLKRTSDIQADASKSFFTAAAVQKNANALAIARKKIIAEEKAFLEGLDKAKKIQILDQKKAYDQSKQALETTKKQLEEVNIKLADSNVKGKDRAKALKELGKLNNTVISQEAKTNSYLKERSVATLALLEVQRKAVKEAEQQNIEYGKSAKFFDNFGDKVQDLSKRLKKGTSLLTGALGAIGLSFGVKELLDGAFKFDNLITDISKKSGVSKDFTKQIENSYVTITTNGTKLNSVLDASLLNVTNQLKAQTELQQNTEAMTLFTNKSVQDQIVLTQQYGLQSEEAAKIWKLSALNNKTAQQSTDEIIHQTALINKQTGYRIDAKKVLTDVAKIEGALAASYKNDPKLIAEAVAQARALGTTLEDSRKASESLLDFQSSIENELEAEVLSGKKWNLEKARSLALQGEYAKADKEILKNVGSLADFERENVIVRQAQAKAAGRTVDELAEVLKQQDILKTSSRETQKAYEEQLKFINSSADKRKYLAELSSASNETELKERLGIIGKQKQFEQSMEKVKDLIVEMTSGPLLGVISKFSKLLENTTALKGILIGVSALMGAIAASALTAAIAVTIATGGTNLAIGALAGGAVLGGLLATGGLSGLSKNQPVKQQNDALISPSGQIMLSTPEGMIKPNKNDSVILTTDPKGVLSGGNSGKSDQLLSAILTELRKPAGVYIDSHRAGTALGMSYSAYA